MSENDSASKNTTPKHDSNFLATPTVLVVVGETNYHVHENLLVGASDFFDKALNSGFKESHDKKVELPQEELVSETLPFTLLKDSKTSRKVSIVISVAEVTQ